MIKSCKLVLLSVLALLATGTAKAQTQMGNAPQFLPTGGWQVQKTALSEVRGLKDINLPCVAVANYNNGYSLRLSGSNQKILAMAIDFRQSVFAQGRKYSAQLSIDDKYNRNVSATAFSDGILIFNMRDHGGFYPAVSEGVKMTLNIEDNPMIFSLGSIRNALTELETCSAGGDFSAIVQQASISPSMNQNKATWGEEVTPMPARVSSAIKKSQEAKGQIWQANAGDDMKATLNGWASRAGVKLDWKATGSNKVVDDIRVQGSFEDAVQALMARNAAALGLDANMKGNISSAMASSMPARSAPQQIVPSRMGAGQMGVSQRGVQSGGRWSAPQGTSLQQVLQTWSKQAGVELVWESNQGFAVKRSIGMGGSYEEALQSLLNQYTDEKVRPAAQLNNDPVTGRRTLFVQSTRTL